MKKKRIFNLLFISHECNYFIDNSASFYRMYLNLLYFHQHEDFRVLVLQPKKDKRFEDKNLKKNIKSYYYKHLKIFGNSFNHFLDFNLHFIIKVINIIKIHKIDLIHVDYPYGINILRLITKKPIVYNAFNVESVYYEQIGKFFYKIPPIFRSIYSKYIFFLEKQAIKKCDLVNAFSLDDLKLFISTFNLQRQKLFLNRMGYKKEIFNANIDKILARNNLNVDKTKFIIIFHGFYFINDANKEAIHIIKEKIAPCLRDNNILFLIAGKMPLFKNEKNIKFLGFVKNIESFLYSADIAIVPVFRGSGVRIKMIDYLSARIPMITTKQAKHGLIFENNLHGYIVNSEKPIEDMIQKILYLKDNPNIIKQFKLNIENLLNKNYDWSKILKHLEFKYKDLILKLRVTI